MSYGSQGNTIQESSPHKCGQKSSCSAFNAVAEALSQIFPSSYSSSMFVMLASSSGVSWKVALSDRIYVWSVLCLSKETLLLGPPSLTFPLTYYLWDFELNTLTIVHSSSNQSTSSNKAPGPIYNFGPLLLQGVFKYIFELFNVLSRLTTWDIYIYIYIILNYKNLNINNWLIIWLLIFNYLEIL